MRRRGLTSLLVAVVLAMLATPALAATAGPRSEVAAPDADHLGGAFTICGRVTAFTAPVLGTPGSMTVAGVVDGADHDFPISDTATVDALLAGLAGAGEWACLDVVGDGMGVVTSVVGAVFLVVMALRMRDTGQTTPLEVSRIPGRLAVTLTVVALVAVLVGVIVASVLLGDAKLLLGDVTNWLTGRANQAISFILDTRVPRVTAAMPSEPALRYSSPSTSR